MRKRERRIYLDVLKVLAACAVVLLHTVSGVTDTMELSAFPEARKLFMAVTDLTQWSVPVFLMVSGYLFVGYDCKELPMRVMLKKYCLRIALALLLFGGVYAFVEKLAVGESLSLKLVGESLLMVLQGKSWAHMWYLYLILFLYLLTPLLRNITGILPRWFVYFLLGVVFLRSSIAPFNENVWGVHYVKLLPDYWIYLFYYTYGSLFSYEDTLEETKGDPQPQIAVLQAVAAPVAAAICAIGMALSRWAGMDFQMAYNYPFTVLLSVSIFAWARSWSRMRKRESLKLWQKQEAAAQTEAAGSGDAGEISAETMAGRSVGEELPEAAENKKNKAGFWEITAALTFGIYLIHPVFLNFCYKFLKVTPLSYDLWWSLPLFFGGALLSAAAATWVLRKIPFMRKSVL